MSVKFSPIAIVGIGCRFPGGADSPSSLWNLLCQGFDGIGEVPESRWDLRRFYDPDPNAAGKMYVRKGGFLQQDLSEFDSSFFGISPREAVKVDPQQRLLLEVAWEALEDAGIVPDRIEGSDTGMFIGSFTTDWQLLHNSPFNIRQGDMYTGINAASTALSARLSYFFNFRGPCLTVDTACSSSLVAVHLACESIWNKEASLCLAGGVNLMLVPETMIAMSKGKFLSPDGCCASFSEKANGYARGEGAGIVVLKPYEAALREGDRIYAVIRGTGVNHDGKTQGMAMPNPQAQRELISQVLEKASIRPESLQYIEAHGTGTPVGDPIEVSALREILQGRKDKCYLGSIKSNIGHLEAAAGAAGIIKASLCLKNRKIPKNIRSEPLNIKIDFACMEVAQGLVDFPNPGGSLYAGVNSFGYGGTNSHAVLQSVEQEKEQRINTSDKMFLFPFSAHNPNNLPAVLETHADFLHRNPEISVQDYAYTLCQRRTHHRYRVAFAASSLSALQNKLQEGLKEKISVQPALESPKIAFIFTGMGPQWGGMGRELYKTEPEYKKIFDSCAQIIEKITGWSLLEKLEGEKESASLDDPVVAQLANFSLQASLEGLFRSWDIMPDAIVGHSVGEIAAAYAAGAISLEDALKICYVRSSEQAKKKGGAMLAVELSEAEAAHYVAEHRGKISLAAANSHCSFTLSGDAEVLKAISEELDKKNIFSRFLKVNIAYHSCQMDSLEKRVLSALAGISSAKPHTPLISSVTGTWVKDPHSLEAEYWWRNLRDTVQFSRAMDTLLKDGCNILVEVGPHPVLARSLKEALERNQLSGQLAGTLARQQPEQESLHAFLGKLHSCGAALNWHKINSAEGRMVSLPAYPWLRQKHWEESERSRQYRLGSKGHPMLSRRSEGADGAWEVELNTQFFPWLRDHKVKGSVIFPAAGYIEAILALFQKKNERCACLIRNCRFLEALRIGAEEPLLRISWNQADPREIFVHSLEDRNSWDWKLHSSSEAYKIHPPAVLEKCNVEELQSRLAEVMAKETIYSHFNMLGLEYGASFQRIQDLRLSSGEALGQIDAAGMEDEYYIHPAVLDSAFQCLIGSIPTLPAQNALALPVSLDEFYFYSKPAGQLFCHAKSRMEGNNLLGDIVLMDRVGNIHVRIKGLKCRLIKEKAGESDIDAGALLYGISWKNYEWKNSAAPKNVSCYLGFLDSASAGIIAQKLSDNGTPCRFFDPQLLDDKQAAQSLVAQMAMNDSVAIILSITQEERLINLCQSILALGEKKAFTLCLLTHGTQNGWGGKALFPNGSSLWGMVRVLRHEMPYCRFILADCLPSDFSLEMLSSRENEFWIRGKQARTQRLFQVPKEELPALRPACLNSEIDNFALQISSPGSVKNLYFQQTETVLPGPGEVQIKIHTASLNFKDLMKVLGLLDESVLAGTYFGSEFGMECSAIVTAVGKGVHNYRPGDAVIAFAPGIFCSRAVVPVSALSQVLPGVSMEESPIYIPFITVLYALNEIASLQKGETILIHSAAGAVGLAAIQYAKYAGAKIIATAGSPEKREYLRMQGADFVADSRSLSFYQEVQEWTEGKGVDVVLNSLSGEALQLSWALLASRGRFIEIGKRDIAENCKLPMNVFNRNAQFAAIDLDRLFKDSPKVIKKLVRQAIGFFQKGIFKSLPIIVYPAAKVEEAFHTMAQARQIGKVMLRFDKESVEAKLLKTETPIFKEEASYLVTGGLGGLGFETAKWLAKNGARYLILLSRNGVTSELQNAEIEALRKEGIRVEIPKADIADLVSMERYWKIIKKELPPLKGVFHCAMVLEDGLISNVTIESLKKVMQPKATGCWNLHHLTKNMELDHFVLFSSLTSLLGNQGQAAYAAANAFLDAFAHYRRELGLPALAINFGAISDVGVAAQKQAYKQHFQKNGIEPISAKNALEALRVLLNAPSAQYGIMHINWARMLSHNPSLKDDPLLENFKGYASVDNGNVNLAAWQSLSQEEQFKSLIQLIKEKVAQTLKLHHSQIEGHVKLSKLGIDSLMAMELQHAMEQRLGIKIPAMELMRGPTINELSKSILHLIAKQ